jgi:pilus assembly protein CpaF
MTTVDAREAVKSRVRGRLLDEGLNTGLTEQVAVLVRAEAPLISENGRQALVAEIVGDVAGLGPLEPLLADPDVSEVMVNGPSGVWVERGGELEQTSIRLDASSIEHLIEKVIAPLGLRVDRASPMVDARLPDGSRVNAVVPPLAIDGPYVTVRRFGTKAIPLDAFCSRRVGAMLSWAVRARLNIVVSGATGAGKTTLLNALAAHIGRDERVVTVEDAAELQLPGGHVVRLEARPANAEGAGSVTIRDLVRNALRMRPDRIVVGEVRGAEALDMLQAMNTGHEGSLSTCHANSPADALRRLETMVLMGEVGLPLAAVREQLTSALDVVVQVARRPNGRRAVVEVAEIVDDDDAGDGSRVRRLAHEKGVLALPSRPGRALDAAPPDPRWLGRAR